MKDYDPIGVTKQTVRLTFQVNDYATQVDRVVGGNCSGLTIIESGISLIYEHDCPEDSDGVHLILMNPNDDTLKSCEIDHIGGGEEWLKDILVKAEIIDVQPDN